MYAFFSAYACVLMCLCGGGQSRRLFIQSACYSSCLEAVMRGEKLPIRPHITVYTFKTGCNKCALGKLM